MSWFRAFRSPSGETWYDEQHVAVSADVTHVAVIFACAVISAAMLISVIGIRGKDKWTTFLRVLYSLFMFITILVTLFGNQWQVSNLKSKCPYKVMSGELVSAEIQVDIGLNNVNITLAGNMDTNFSQYVYYNERFSWYGIHQAKDEYDRARDEGSPYPILLVAEYISMDKGGLRWHRGFRQAGYYTYILLWTTFGFWILANLLLCMVVFYGAFLVVLSGITMTTAAVIYHVLQPAYRLVIPFEDGFVQLSYGWCFWLVLGAGILTIIIGFLICVMEQCAPVSVSNFFLLETSYIPTEDKQDKHIMQHMAKHDDLDVELKMRRYIQEQVQFAKPKFSFADFRSVTNGNGLINGKNNSLTYQRPGYYVNHSFVPDSNSSNSSSLENIPEHQYTVLPSRRGSNASHFKRQDSNISSASFIEFRADPCADSCCSSSAIYTNIDERKHSNKKSKKSSSLTNSQGKPLPDRTSQYSKSGSLPSVCSIQDQMLY